MTNSAPSSPDPRPARALAALAAVSVFLLIATGATFSALGIVLPAMVAALNWDWATAGLGFTLLGLACGLSSPVPAMLISRIGARWTIASGAAVMSAGLVGLASLHTSGAYLLSALATGAGYGISSTVPATSVINRLFVQRSRAMGVYFTFGTLGGAAAPGLYIAITAAGQDWRIYWLAMALLVAGCGLFATIAVPSADRPAANVPAAGAPAISNRATPAWSIQAALRTWQFHLISMGYMIYLLANTAAHSFAVAHLAARQIAPQAVSTMLIGEAAVAAVMSAIGGALGERIDPRWLLAGALGATAVGLLALTYADGAPLMAIYAVGVGTGYGLSFVSSAVLLFNYFGERASTPLYSTMCLFSTIAAVAPLAGGTMRDLFGSFTLFFLLCAGLTATVGLAISQMRPPVPAVRNYEDQIA